VTIGRLYEYISLEMRRWSFRSRRTQTPVIFPEDISDVPIALVRKVAPARHTNSIGMEFVRIEAGEYMRGSTLAPEEVVKKYGGEAEWYKDEHPRHRVVLTKPFYMAATPVTRGQFAQFAREANYKTDAEKEGWAYAWKDNNWGKVDGASWRAPGFPQTDSHPVVCVSWNDAVAFVQWLSRKEGKTYRLPTEAEWEYAARAGSTTEFIWGDNPDDGAGWANAADLTAKQQFPNWTTFNWRDGYVFTSPVGSFKPNAWGLYDMIGNVWEWCLDWYGDYPAGAVTDPKGPATGRSRVLRGGSWLDIPRICRSALRSWFTPDSRILASGFALCSFTL